MLISEAKGMVRGNLGDGAWKTRQAMWTGGVRIHPVLLRKAVEAMLEAGELEVRSTSNQDEYRLRIEQPTTTTTGSE